jgi:uncharacterized protein (DUF924 family)
MREELPWTVTTNGRLACIILLDQLSRGAFRGTPEAFAGDAVATALAKAAYSAGDDKVLSVAENTFLLLPLMHSELLEDQKACLAHAKALAASHSDVPATAFTLSYAEQHEAVIRRFGHFPHRNGAKGRISTPEELVWLASKECPGWAKSQG